MCKHHSSLPLSLLGIYHLCLCLSPNSPVPKSSSHFGLGPPKRPHLQMSHSGVLGWALQHMSFVVAVVSDSLPPHWLQHPRLPCLSLSPEVYPNSCPLSRWCLMTISSSVHPFSSCFPSFPASECFPVNQFFASGGQSIGVSASVSVLPVNIQSWFPLG